MRAISLIPMLVLTGLLCAQTPPSGDVHDLKPRPMFSVDVVERVTVAINYRHRSGATRIDFQGTNLMPAAAGTAKVESQQGYIRIVAKFRNLEPAIRFGAEYLTYVLWAITPEGRAANLGEIHVNDGRSKLNVTTELQVFGLIVTAEPYFAVRQPSDLVVLENEIRPDTKGKFEVIDAKYELLKRGEYEKLSNPLSLTVDPKIPLELYEARNAVQIARSSGAAKYAEDTFLKAEQSLRQAVAYHARNAGRKPVAMLAREAVQTAEDAREIAVRRRVQERLKREREEAARREEVARKTAEQERQRRTAAEAEQKKRAEAAVLARRQAEREAAERKRIEVELAAAREATKKAEEKAARAFALLKERTASFGEERATWERERAQREEAELERKRRSAELGNAELRVRIYSEVSRVLFTRDTDQGLAVELPANLFERGSDRLSSQGREKLAMLAGLLLAHPGLRVGLPAEGADPGADPDLRRAEQVRAYLVDCGIVAERLWASRRVPSGGPTPVVDAAIPVSEHPVTLLISGPRIEPAKPTETTAH